MKQDSLILNGICANLNALHQMLHNAAQQTLEASNLADNQQQNAAIGTIILLEDMLQQATALYHAIIALHRFKPVEGLCR